MNVIVNTGVRLLTTPDGISWAPGENLAYSYWTRFLDVFETVTVVARTFNAERAPTGAVPASGDGVDILCLPNFKGVTQYAAQYWRIRKYISNALREPVAVYLSLPCVLGDLMTSCIERGRPYAVGVVGDPYDVFAPGASHHPLRALLRHKLSKTLRQRCQGACACTYVTRHTLQRRYPAHPSSFTTYYSSAHLTAGAFVLSPRPILPCETRFRIVHVGTFDTWYKGADVLLRAVALCVGRRVNAEVTFIGDGRHRTEVERIAGTLHLEGRVRFLGQLPSAASVCAQLDASDLFALPSRTEGLPKAMIEAMARGLPCVGTAVGGIPELLEAEDMVPADDAAALSGLIEAIANDPQRRHAMSSRNLQTAKQYRTEVLRERRIALYKALRGHTEMWLANRSTAHLRDGLQQIV